MRNNFDLLRVVLAVLVIYSHSYVIFSGKIIDTDPGMIFTGNQVDLASVAVAFFFIISGFLVTRSFLRSKSIGQYLKNRFLRIYPGFFVAFLVSVLIVAPLSMIYYNHQWMPGNIKVYMSLLEKKDFFLDLFSMQSPHVRYCFTWLPLPGMVNESLWTIQYEFLCYLLLPILGILGIFKRRYFILIAFIISYAFFTFQKLTPGFLDEKNLPTGIVRLLNPVYIPKFFVLFLSGACFYLYRRFIVRNKWLFMASLVAVVATSIWIKGLEFALPFAGSYILFYMVYHPKVDFSGFAKKGDYSYGIYLYGWIVQQSVMLLLFRYLNPFLLFIISIPIVYVAAYISWHLVEKRFLRLKKISVFPSLRDYLRKTKPA